VARVPDGVDVGKGIFGLAKLSTVLLLAAILFGLFLSAWIMAQAFVLPQPD
jgi:hypothetical protein